MSGLVRGDFPPPFRVSPTAPLFSASVDLAEPKRLVVVCPYCDRADPFCNGRERCPSCGAGKEA